MTTQQHPAKLRLGGKAEIISLNTRKEGPDDDKELAVDVKLRLVTTAQVLAFFDQELAPVFFTDAGAVRNAMIGPIPMLHELQDYRMDMLGNSHFGVKLKKFTLQPLDGARIVLIFQASLKPSSTEIATIAEYLQDEINIALEPTSEELDFGKATEDALSGDTAITYGSEADPMYDQAVSVVMEHRKASISLVQRHLRIGYNRAARLLEAMEQSGVVSPMGADGSRSILREGASA